MKQPKPSLSNRMGFSFETPDLGTGKVAHLPVSLSLLYATRGTRSKDGFGRGRFSLLQFGLLGHDPILGWPWLAAAAGFTPGYALGSRSEITLAREREFKTYGLEGQWPSRRYSDSQISAAGK